MVGINTWRPPGAVGVKARERLVSSGVGVGNEITGSRGDRLGSWGKRKESKMIPSFLALRNW